MDFAVWFEQKKIPILFAISFFLIHYLLLICCGFNISKDGIVYLGYPRSTIGNLYSIASWLASPTVLIEFICDLSRYTTKLRGYYGILYNAYIALPYLFYGYFYGWFYKRIKGNDLSLIKLLFHFSILSTFVLLIGGVFTIAVFAQNS